MRVAILHDIHQAWEGTEGVRRLRERAEVRVFTGPFGDPAALRGFDAVIANRERNGGGAARRGNASGVRTQ